MCEKVGIGNADAESYKNARKHVIKVEKKLFIGDQGVQERFKIGPTKAVFRMNSSF